MREFKVGDKVRLLQKSGINYKGDVGYITCLSSIDCRVSKTNDPKETVNWVSYNKIELVEEKPTVDVHNTQKKTWGEMTPEEKGALLLADYEGKTIEFFLSGSTIWRTTYTPQWCSESVYRVKPLPVVETVEMYSVGGDCFTDYRQANDKYKITYQTVDGEPDWSTLKGETL